MRCSDNHPLLLVLGTSLLALALQACTGHNAAPLTPDSAVSAMTPGQFPHALPLDGAQPWERLDAAGRVVPDQTVHALQAHLVSSIDANSVFVPGVERFLEGGSVADLGEAAQLASGAAGARQLSYATYRLSLGAEQPGVVAADVNLRLQTGGSGLSGYYLGLSDYTHGRWEWHGPYSNSHVRVSTGAAVAGSTDYTSALGNLFVCVVAYDGAKCDVVGVGCNAFNGADVTPPSPPVGLSATPVAGGLRLQWNSVLEAGLAGYRVYWRQSAFTNPRSPGVQAVDYLEGATLHLLALPNASPHSVAIAAVDFSGNESALSLIVQAAPLAGSPPVVELTASSPSARQGEVITLSATGAQNYSFDLDGDGVIDITNATGLANVDTASPGLVRPLVIGSGPSGSAVALGGVSLLITGNTRPVASAQANPQSGVAPLGVNFVGLAEDLEDPPASLSYAWDFNDDGIYEPGTDTLAPPLFVYNAPGLWNVKFRVTDSQGSWDVDTISVYVTPKSGTEETLVDAGVVQAWFDAAVVDGRPAVIYANNDNLELLYRRATRADGGAWSPAVTVSTPDSALRQVSLAVIAGKPALLRIELDGDMYYCRSTDSQGNNWNNDLPLFTGANQTNCKLIDCGGLPGVVYYDAAYAKAFFWRATDVDGFGWGMTQQVSSDFCGYNGLSAAMINGFPALAYTSDNTSDVFYRSAAASDGSSWNAQITATSDFAGASLDLAAVNGVPCIAVADQTNSLACFIRAALADGTSWVQPRLVVPHAGVWQNACGVRLAVLGGKPAVSFVDSFTGLLWYTPSADQLGEAWNQPRALGPLQPGYSAVASNTALLNLGGTPGVAYLYTDIVTMRELRLVRSYDP